MKMSIPGLENEADWSEFRDEVVTYSKYYPFEDILTSEKHIPAGATGIDGEVYICENDVSAALYDRYMKTWTFFNRAIVMKIDKGRMKRFLSPSELSKETKKLYLTSTRDQQNKLRNKLNNFQMVKGSNPVVALLEIRILPRS